MLSEDQERPKKRRRLRSATSDPPHVAAESVWCGPVCWAAEAAQCQFMAQLYCVQACELQLQCMWLAYSLQMERRRRPWSAATRPPRQLPRRSTRAENGIDLALL